MKKTFCLTTIEVIMKLTAHLKINSFKSLPNHKFLDLSKLKAFADDKTNVN